MHKVSGTITNKVYFLAFYLVGRLGYSTDEPLFMCLKSTQTISIFSQSFRRHNWRGKLLTQQLDFIQITVHFDFSNRFRMGSMYLND